MLRKEDAMKILIAEDEHDLLEAVKTILSHKGYHVETVDNGLDALDYLSAGLYDLAILDIMMPGLSGLQVLEQIRQGNNPVPVLLLTARSQVSDKVDGLRLGADDYLTKPFAMEELLARMEALLRRPRANFINKLSFGDITLDRGDFTMTRTDSGQFVSLNNKEFQLMELFMRNSQQVLSKEQIMDNIWGLDTDAEINVVWVNISSLRGKLKELGSSITIRAQRGLGYRLED